MIEVPQDISADTLRQLQEGIVPTTFTIHEHINFYRELSLRKLLEVAAMEIISIEAVAIDSPLGKQIFVRGLARRPHFTSVLVQQIERQIIENEFDVYSDSLERYNSAQFGSTLTVKKLQAVWIRISVPLIRGAPVNNSIPRHSVRQQQHE